MTTDTSTNTGHPPDGQGWARRTADALWLPVSAVRRPYPGPEAANVQPEPAPRPPRSRTPRPWDSWPASVRLAVVGTCVVLSACWAVSANAIVDAAMAAGTPFLLALLCPLIVDGEMAIGTLALVAIARRVKRRTRVYLGFLILLSVTASMAANMAHPWTGWLVANGKSMSGPWSYIASGVASAWIALIVHQLVILWRHSPRVDEHGVADQDGVVSTPQPDTLPVQPEPAPIVVSVERVPDTWTGVRSADGRWWWDGVRWCPVPASIPEPQARPALPLHVVHGATEQASDETVGGAVDASSRPSAPRPLPESVAERQAVLSTWLREQVDGGRDLTNISVSEASRETGIPRPTIVRWLDGATLSTFRPEPARAGGGVAA